MPPSTSPLTNLDEPSIKTNLRVLSQRRSLPGSRAIAGGVLVAIAVLGTYGATAQAGKGNERTVLVAAHDIAPGTRLQASDLKTIKLPLNASITNHVLQSTSKISGATVLGPLHSGDLVQSSAITQSPSPYLEISFSLPAARALDGNLQPGETVDILTTNKSDTTATAHVAVTNAHILRSQNASNGSIGHSGEVIVAVGVNSRSDAAAIAGAVDQGQITLVRTTGIAANE